MQHNDAHVIEDDILVRDLIRQFLFGLGFQKITTNRSYIAAKNNLSKINAPLIFIDIELGDGNGLHLIPSLKQHLPDCKIIVVSSYTTPDNVKGAVAKGANGFLGKPFSIDNFRKTLLKVGVKLNHSS